jgi:phytoene desaturase
MSKHVVVIGAGPGGLAVAMILASRGVRVTLLERRHRVGGRTSAIEADGPLGGRFRFDVGPTFFLYPAVLEEVFTACGENLHDHVKLTRLDPQYHLIFEQGGELRATPDVARMQSEMSRLDPHDARNLPAFLADNRRKFAAFKPILQRPWSSWTDLLSFNPLKMLPLVRPWSSVDSDLRRHFRDPRTRLAFSFQSKYLGMSPFQCPSLFTILSFLEYEYGVFHPEGGCAAVSEAMAKVASTIGVDIRLNEQVEAMRFDGRRCTGVVTSAGAIDCDAVVVNADFADAMTRLVPDRLRRRWTDRKLARKKYSCSTFMLYLGIEGRHPELSHHTIFLAGDYEQNLRDIEIDHRLSDNPSFYVHNPSSLDPTLAPAGHSTLYVLAPVSHEHGNIDWRRDAGPFRRTVLSQLRKLGLGDIEPRIRFEKMITPAEWSADMRVYRGATFNLAHTLQQMLHLRPNNRFEDLDGVYLTGGGTHPGSGLPVIYESARITGKLLLDDLGVPNSIATRLPLRSADTPATQPPKLVEVG